MVSEKPSVPTYKKIIRSKAIRLKLLSIFDFLPDILMVKLQYALYFGRKLDLDHPRRFSEKLQWYKLFYRDPLMIKCVDKIAVREFVKDRGCGETLTTMYAVVERPDEIDLDALPSSFVAKYNNGAQRNIIVRDKSSLNYVSFKSEIGSWLASPLSKLGREWSYYGVDGKVLIEEYLEPDQQGDLIDYKFFCFDGQPRFLYVLKDRFSADGLKLGIFDTDFNQINAFRAGIKKLEGTINKPQGFDKMLEVAKALSKGFPHVRVDLYNINGKIVFGELTFYDGSGYVSYTPDEFDYFIGDLFALPPKKT